MRQGRKGESLVDPRIVSIITKSENSFVEKNSDEKRTGSCIEEYLDRLIFGSERRSARLLPEGESQSVLPINSLTVPTSNTAKIQSFWRILPQEDTDKRETHINPEGFRKRNVPTRGSFESSVRAMTSRYSSIFREYFNEFKVFGLWKRLSKESFPFVFQKDLEEISKFVKDFAKCIITPLNEFSLESMRKVRCQALDNFVKGLTKKLPIRIHIKLWWEPHSGYGLNEGKIQKNKYLELKGLIRSEFCQLSKSGVQMWGPDDPFYFYNGHVYFFFEKCKDFPVFKTSDVLLDLPLEGRLCFQSSCERHISDIIKKVEEMPVVPISEFNGCVDVMTEAVSPGLFFSKKMYQIVEKSRERFFEEEDNESIRVEADHGDSSFGESEGHEMQEVSKFLNFIKTNNFGFLSDLNMEPYKCIPGPWEDSICSVLEKSCFPRMKELASSTKADDVKFITLSISHVVQLQIFLEESKFLKLSKISGYLKFENQKGALVVVRKPSASARRMCAEVLNIFNFNTRSYFYPITECGLLVLRKALFKLAENNIPLQFAGVSCLEIIDNFEFYSSNFQ